MRLLTFTLLAIAISVAVQWGLDELPLSVRDTMDGFGTALFFLSPVIVTAGLARAMRIPNVLYVYFAIILSPFVSWISLVLFSMFVLNEPFHLL